MSHGGASDPFVAAVARYPFGTQQTELILQGVPIYASYPDIVEDDDPVVAQEGFQGIAVVPVSKDRRVVGSLNLATCSAQVFPESTRVTVESIAAQVGGAMARLVAERQRGLLTRELDHRVRNNLAIVQSLASRIFDHTDTVEGFRTAFLGRIEAMANVHELLAESSWGGLGVRTAVARALAPILGDQVSLEGPDERLRPEPATSLGLVLHELGANAVQHGALSCRDGQVELTWHADGSELTMCWQECGGPAVDPPSHRRGGTTIIRAIVESKLGGELELDFDEGGVCCRMRLPEILELP